MEAEEAGVEVTQEIMDRTKVDLGELDLEDAKRLLYLAELGEQVDEVDPNNAPVLAILRMRVTQAEREARQ